MNLLLLTGMAFEGARQRELAQFVADHVLGHEDGDVFAPIMHRQRVADHLREDRRAARPCLDDALLVARIHVVDLLQQLGVRVRTLFE
jgi:hypothetical protein